MNKCLKNCSPIFDGDMKIDNFNDTFALLIELLYQKISEDEILRTNPDETI